MVRRAVLARCLWAGFDASLAVLALAAAAASSLSSTTVLRLAITSSSDDQVLRGAETLLAAFPRIVLGLRLSAAVLALAAVAIWYARKAIQTWIAEAVLPLPGFLRGAAKSLVQGLKTDGPVNVAVLLGLWLSGAALRFRFLFRPMRFDEATSFINFASRPWYVALSWYPEPNNHILHTLLMHLAWLWFGSSEWALRLPAFISGVLLIPVAYWTGRELYGKHAALIAAGIIAAASPLVGYSVEGRGYTMICLFFLLLLILGRYLMKHESGPAWLLWILTAVAGFYTVPTMLYAVATAATWLALSFRATDSQTPLIRRQLQLAAGLCFAGVLTVLLYTPVLAVSGWRALMANPFVKVRSFAFLAANLPLNFRQIWRFFTTDVPLPLVILFSAGLAIALWKRAEIDPQRVPLPAAAALCVPVLVLAQRVLPYARIWIFLLPMFAIVSAAGLWHALRRLPTAYSAHAAAAVAIGVFFWMSASDLGGASLNSSPHDNMPNAAAWLQHRLKPGDTILAAGGIRAPFSYQLTIRRIPLISRPAPCNPHVIVAYTPVDGSHTADAKQFLIMAGPRESLESFGACIGDTRRPAPVLIYDHGSIRIFEWPHANGTTTPLHDD